METQLDSTFQFHARALNLRSQRQQLLASNIANADTPGYKARDIDFAKSLQQAVAGRDGPLRLARTSPAHLAAVAGTDAAVLYRTVMQPSVDDNTVDMDVERSQFADNAIHYEANLAFINGELKALLTALQG